jgi:hypothetical protein
LEDSPRPSNDELRARLLAKLWLHFPSPDLTKAEATELAGDYLDALDRFSPDVLAKGIKSGLTRWRFMPKIAEIVAAAQPFQPAPDTPRPALSPPEMEPLDPAERERRLALIADMPDGAFKRFLTSIAEGPKPKA